MHHDSVEILSPQPTFAVRYLVNLAVTSSDLDNLQDLIA